MIILGAGNMAEALLTPLKENFSEWELWFYTPSVTRAKKVAGFMGQKYLSNEIEIRQHEFDGVFLAHKPQQLTEATKLIKHLIFKDDSFLISILAGVTSERLSKVTSIKNIIRLMPNTPCLVGEGIITSYCTKDFDMELKSFLFQAFESSSHHLPFDEEAKFDEMTPILGSGPGVIFELARIFQSALEETGQGSAQSKQLVGDLFKGSMQLAQSSEDSFDELKNKVTSKGGITERMLEVFQEHNLEKVVKLAFNEGRERGKKL